MNAPVPLQTVQQQGGAIATVPQGGQMVRAGFFDLAGFELLQRVAKAFATSTLVPVAYQGNVANCMIALNLARRLGADELMVMQNLYIVHGNPGWSSKFLIASVNTCGRFSNMRYEWKGKPGDDDYGCRAWATERLSGDRLEGIWVDWKMVKAEGWNSKNGSKWKTMPDVMFQYRAAAFWTRAYAPEISMGLQTQEELQDVIDVHADGTYTVTTEALRKEIGVIDNDGVIVDGQPSADAQPDGQPAEQKLDPAPAPSPAPAPEPAASPSPAASSAPGPRGRRSTAATAPAGLE
ncbi:hypothetical protein [Roseateles aquatilis]|uniref:hypothetical protein n=1 Tax=Roseateles aquatilis TaxID=431061 RepID=UPI001873CBAB|nr:hypothetical protein [Roseateles aquatilis]